MRKLFIFSIASFALIFAFIIPPSISTSLNNTNVTVVVTDGGNLSFQYPLVVIGGVPTYTLTVESNFTNMTLSGSLFLNGDDVNITLKKSKQTAFEIGIIPGTSSNDLILIPYDFYLSNVTTLLDNNTGYFNYSIYQYHAYPSSKSTILTLNTSGYFNRTNLNNIVLSRDDVVEIRYGNFSNISKAVVAFELLKK